MPRPRTAASQQAAALSARKRHPQLLLQPGQDAAHRLQRAAKPARGRRQVAALHDGDIGRIGVQRGTPDEYRSAVLGASNHFGTLQVDAVAGLLIFDIQNSSYPNQEGTRQQRPFRLEGDTLSYRVPPRPDGSQPVSVWRRLP